MCGRYQISTAADEIAGWFKTTGPLPNTRPRYNAAPAQSLPIVIRDKESGERRLDTHRWGLIPFWAKDAKIGYSTINAMCETVATKPAFRDAFKSRRCLVPADGYYEWKKLDAKTKQPYRFALADRSLMGFAGLWERWKDPASGGDHQELHDHHRRAHAGELHRRLIPRAKCCARSATGNGATFAMARAP